MLQLSEVNPFQRFTSDQLIWHRDYWKYLTRASGPKRDFLSRDKQIMNVIRFAFFSLIETRLHRVESKDYQNTFDGKIQSFVEEFKKLLDHQNLLPLAQNTILEKLTNLEPNTISNSGLSEEECVPCPTPPPCQTTETIQSSNQLEPELIALKQKLQGILNRLNIMENPYRSIIVNIEEINDGLNKIEKDLTNFSEKFNFFHKSMIR